MFGTVPVTDDDTDSLPGYTSSIGRGFAALPDSVKRAMRIMAKPHRLDSGNNIDIISPARRVWEVRGEWSLNDETETITFHRGLFTYWIRFHRNGVSAG
jgi:hypothetical protein